MSEKKIAGIEQSLQRLQVIIRNLDAEETSLEESITLYEEAIGIVEVCAKELSQAGKKVKELRKRADDVFEILDFETD